MKPISIEDADHRVGATQTILVRAETIDVDTGQMIHVFSVWNRRSALVYCQIVDNAGNVRSENASFGGIFPYVGEVVIVPENIEVGMAMAAQHSATTADWDAFARRMWERLSQ